MPKGVYKRTKKIGGWKIKDTSAWRNRVGKKAAHWKGGKPKCIICGKELSTYKSRYCKKHSFQNERHWNWKGGINLKNERIRHSLEWQVWRSEVYQRDNYTCRLCGKHCQNEEIVAHHIKLFSEYPELRFSVDNGLTLCRSCHLKIHSGNKNNNLKRST